MAKPQKSTKKSQVVPFWRSSWAEFDRAFENLRRDLERSFTSFPSLPSLGMPQVPKIPQTSCDVIDEGNQFRIRMDIPGVKKNEIDLNVTDNSIEISAGHKESKEEKKKNYLRKERSEVSYYRTLPLPEKVQSNKANAKLTDGVLDVVIPKVKPTPKPKKRAITVK